MHISDKKMGISRTSFYKLLETIPQFKKNLPSQKDFFEDWEKPIKESDVFLKYLGDIKDQNLTPQEVLISVSYTHLTLPTMAVV